MIFSKGNPKTNYEFTLNSEPLEIVSEYKYLGIYFSKGGSFLSTKTNIANQASRAMYSLIKKAKHLLLPINMQIDLFNKLVKPILLYGCEVWGYGNIDVIERVQLKFLKCILNMKSSTPNSMVYGETGTLPIRIDINSRMISFWTKLTDFESNKLSSYMYTTLYSHFSFSPNTGQNIFCG